MLKQRVITALVLLAVLLPALFYPAPEPFTAIVLVLIVAGAWEWARLNGWHGMRSWGCAAVCLGMCLAAWQGGLLDVPLPGLWLAAGGLWVIGGAWLLRAGVAGWPGLPVVVRIAGGLLALWLAWLAAAQARFIGINFLLSVLVLVWMADIAAYFGGRAFGRRKLAVGISPGKSWEGVWSGMAGVLLLAVCWVLADRHWAAEPPSLYTQAWNRAFWFAPVALVFLCAMSVVGDLAESLVKRAAGVKDSSGLLPGHGGVLDRVDALLPALPLAMMIRSL